MSYDPVRIAERIVDAYRPAGGLSFCYGQGSVFTGFVEDSDLDINLIWDRSEIPGAAEFSGISVQGRFDQPGFALDKLNIAGWQVDVAHHSKRTFDGWCAQVAAGDGWQNDVWPLPLHATAGFAYGVVIDDLDGSAREAADELARFPEPLIERSRAALADELPSYDSELAGCVRRGDGWLFHLLLTRLLRTVYVAWFSGHRRYCPFPKRLPAWADRFGFDDGIVDLDQRLWSTSDPTSKHELARTMAERVL